MSISRAGADDGTTDPEDVNILNVREDEDSHGSPMGEPGLIILWDGEEYDSDISWLMCHEDDVCKLGCWE